MNIKNVVVALVTLIASSAAQAQQAVQWRLEDGGNGHWYLIDPTPRLWFASRAFAAAIGGELAAFETPGEAAWCQANAGFNGAVNLGGQQDAGSVSPSAGWRWLNGTAVTLSWFAFAFDDSPCNLSFGGENGFQDYLHSSGSYLALGDVNADPFPGCDHNIHLYASLVEWSADCNGDGIVDYGQIQRGELIDLNSNGVPDICETSISSVIPPSVPSQGGSTITIRGNFPPNPIVKVGGVPATNVTRVSITQITATTPALLPGMASVQVNDFTLPEAIYIRPECGSDLDQNGSVDAGDIGIILLDFGQCYTNPLAAPVDPDVPPLLEAKPVTETRTRR